VSATAMLNNADFGIPAFAGGLVATFFCDREWRNRIFISMACGLPIAILVFSAYTWHRSGALPRFDQFLMFQEAFATYGVSMVSMPVWGWHWLSIATYVGASVWALVAYYNQSNRMSHREKIGFGLLAYTGIFGAGSFTYYVGRSVDMVLIATFAGWGMCLSVLVYKYFTLESERRNRWITCSFVLLAPCILAMICDQPSVSYELARLTRGDQKFIDENNSKIELIKKHSNPKAGVMVIAPFGHTLAAKAGVVNAFPFVGPWSLILKSQLAEIKSAILKQRVEVVFTELVPKELDGYLLANEFTVVAVQDAWQVWRKK
jgi:hypothetical protein